MTIAEECRAAQWLAYAKLYHGWANGFLNDPEAGAEECEEAFREWQSLGLQYEQPRLLATIAELYHHMGKDDLALKSIHRAVEFIEATDYRHCNFEVYRLRGCLRSANGHSVDAEADLLRAIEMAGEQCVKTFELRAARDLATHWIRKGERRKAHDLLAPVYEWFTEGLDTLDLVEAKTLLDDLQ